MTGASGASGARGAGGRSSSAFERLAEPVRRWAWQQGWQSLRDVQEQSIPPILDGRDVIIASVTASGKTEAAFLPLISRACAREDVAGLRVLSVSPLKALINDQCRRIEPLAAAADLPVTPWHGDVAASRKRRLTSSPEGILLITPESLEAMFVLRGSAVAAFFAALDYVVVDELHSFIAAERGRQLQSLLHRVELAIGRSVPRIGLSATIGDLGLAASFLRPGAGTPPAIVASTTARRDVQVQVRGYERPERGNDDETEPDKAAIASHVYDIARRGTHIAFVNQRAAAEEYVDLLRRQAERERAPDRFWPHHGSLAKDVREDAETALRSGRNVTVVATTTLELGIDVGSVDTIVQIGPPPSVASMRQRLGRSGRRDDEASVLRVYVTEDSVTARTAPQDQIRASVVQSAAMVDLLVARWNEAPHAGALHLSTLIQQVLSVAAQRGGFKAADAWRALCATGPFGEVTAGAFAELLRDLADEELIAQTHDGTVLLGDRGERLVNHYDFYSAFVTSDEYRLVAGARTLGTLPVTRPLAIGDLLIFAGRRWRVTGVREEERLIELAPAPGGRAPTFSGDAGIVDGEVRRAMRRVYEDEDGRRPYLDAGARRLVDEGREAYRRLGLDAGGVVAWGDDVVLFPWAGDRTLDTLARMLAVSGMEAARDGPAVLIARTSADDVVDALRVILEQAPSAIDLARGIRNKRVEKHHRFLGEELLSADYASARLDVDGACAAARALCDDA